MTSIRHGVILLALAILGAALAWAFWDALGGYEGARLADLATADAKFLRRYMGEEGYQHFMAFHNLEMARDEALEVAA